MGLGFCPIKAVEGAAAALAVVVQPKAMLALSIGENDADTSAVDMTAEKRYMMRRICALSGLKTAYNSCYAAWSGTFTDISIFVLKPAFLRDFP